MSNLIDSGYYSQVYNFVKSNRHIGLRYVKYPFNLSHILLCIKSVRNDKLNYLKSFCLTFSVDNDRLIDVGQEGHEPSHPPDKEQ